MILSTIEEIKDVLRNEGVLLIEDGIYKSYPAIIYYAKHRKNLRIQKALKHMDSKFTLVTGILKHYIFIKE